LHRTLNIIFPFLVGHTVDDIKEFKRKGINHKYIDV